MIRLIEKTQAFWEQITKEAKIKPSRVFIPLAKLIRIGGT